MEPHDLIETTEASELLGVDVTTVARMAADGRLQGYRPRAGRGIRFRFDRAEVLALAAERRHHLEERLKRMAGAVS